jgi:hypothetical protein
MPLLHTYRYKVIHFHCDKICISRFLRLYQIIVKSLKYKPPHKEVKTADKNVGFYKFILYCMVQIFRLKKLLNYAASQKTSVFRKRLFMFFIKKMAV